ncbi:hypothetical protein MMPV_003190 [Pyropia vietnamensis]
MKACGAGGGLPARAFLHQLLVAHTATAAAVLCCGISLIITATWAVITQNGAPYNRLSFGHSLAASTLFLSMVLISVGVLLVLLAPVGVITLRGGTCPLGLSVAYVVGFLLLGGVSLFAAIVMLQVGTGGVGRPATRAFMVNAWERSVMLIPVTVCAVEAEQGCRGFDRADCDGCPETGGASGLPCDRSRCVDCGATVPRERSCYPFMYRELADKLRPVGIMAAVTSMVVGVELAVFTMVNIADG